MTDKALLPIARLADGYRDKSLTPNEIVSDTLARIDKLEPRLGAFEIVLAEAAREAADAATRAIHSGHRIGPLHGIPFALKDLVDVEGLITTGGTLVHENRIAESTATIAKRLLAAGGILIGKTKTVEVAYGAWGTNTVRGTPWNPWDAETQRTPGGSSSGSGVAVAVGLAGCAVGTDTGGSVRIPSAWCGLAGLKVTEGRLPLDGIQPLSHTLDTPGPMARTVEDAVIMFEALDGRHPVNTDHDRQTDAGLFGEMKRGVSGLRLGILPAAERGGIDGQVLEHYDEAVARLRHLGADIVPLELAASADEMRDGTGLIISCEGYFHHGEIYERPSNRVDEDVKARILAGKSIAARDFIAMLQRRKQNQQSVLKSMRGIDAYLTPTVSTPPQPLSAIDQSKTPARFTRIINYLGFCAMSVPMGLATDGSGPTSLQIAARGNDEAMAIRIAGAYESDRGAFPAPPMAVL
ncbi:MAG: amidase [Hyphomicrobiaceae bacterium]